MATNKRVSPSSRRAWIEMACPMIFASLLHVALLAEGVDRNRSPPIFILIWNSRPPRGGRG